MNRRVFFGKTGISIAACGISFFSPLASRKWDRESEDLISEDDQQLFIGEDIAVAQTKYGKVKGFLQRGIMVFRGIPYGLDTSGKNRFMPPQPPKPRPSLIDRSKCFLFRTGNCCNGVFQERKMTVTGFFRSGK